MSLVNYSSSSDSDSNNEIEENKVEAKKIRLENPKLPLPNLIKNLSSRYYIDDKPNDNPTKHEGRKRSFDHERGNWASFAFVPIDADIIEDIQESIKDYLQSQIDLKFCNDIHISVTKTVILRHHWIDSFVKDIQLKLKTLNKFIVEVKNLKVYCNEDKSRTFIGLQVQSANSLNIIMKMFNEILEEFRLEKFYEDPSFHASILWCLNDQKELITNQLNALQKIVDNYYLKNLENFRINVNSINCKIGNKLYKFNLNER